MELPTQIEIKGARVHNLKNIDVNIPLHKFVAVSGLSGSGKSSLAMGILYEEGSRRYLDALSTYMRRRIKQGLQVDVTSVKHIPSALAFVNVQVFQMNEQLLGQQPRLLMFYV